MPRRHVTLERLKCGRSLRTAAAMEREHNTSIYIYMICCISFIVYIIWSIYYIYIHMCCTLCITTRLQASELAEMTRMRPSWFDSQARASNFEQLARMRVHGVCHLAFFGGITLKASDVPWILSVSGTGRCEQCLLHQRQIPCTCRANSWRTGVASGARVSTFWLFASGDSTKERTPRWGHPSINMNQPVLCGSNLENAGFITLATHHFPETCHIKLRCFHWWFHQFHGLHADSYQATLHLLVHFMKPIQDSGCHAIISGHRVQNQLPENVLWVFDSNFLWPGEVLPCAPPITTLCKHCTHHSRPNGMCKGFAWPASVPCVQGQTHSEYLEITQIFLHSKAEVCWVPLCHVDHEQDCPGTCHFRTMESWNMDRKMDSEGVVSLNLTRIFILA